MHGRSVITGFIAGGLVGGLAVGLLMKDGRGRSAPLQVIRVEDPVLSDAFPDEELYALRIGGTDFGCVTFQDRVLKGILVLDWPNRKQLSVRATDARLFGSINFDHMSADNPYGAELSIIDDDADGMPDRKVEWTASRALISTRETITWKQKPNATASSVDE